MRKRKACLSICGLFLLLCLFLCCMAGCNGIGSSIHGDLPAYSGPSSSTGSDILSYSNAGDTEDIVNLFTGSSAGYGSGSGTGTSTISFSSGDLGLPAGGFVTLTITGGDIAYTADSSASADGNVYFTIPWIASGSTITVSVIVKKQDGSVVCAGSETQTITDSAHDIHVSLLGSNDGPWTLPASIPVSASPTSITYNAASPQDVTFSVAGLTPPPSGTLTYSWQQPGGMTFTETGDSLTANLTQFIGVSPSAGVHSASATVTVTYTDDDGNVSTATGTGVVSVTVLEIPAFTVTVEPPAGVSLHTGTTDEYDVADRTQQFTFTATPAAGTAFPDDAVFAWTINGIPQSGNTESIDASPDDFNCATLIATSAMGNVIICEVSSSKAVNSPVSDNTNTLNLWKPTLPTPVIDVPTTSNGTYIGAEGTTYSFYAVSGVSANTNFSFSTSTTMPAGTTFNWKVDGESKTGDSGTASLSNWALGSLKTGLDAPCTFSVTCTAICPGYDNIESDPITVKVLTYPSSVPDFYVWISPYPGGQTPALSGGTVYIHGVENSTIGVRVGKTDAYGTVELPASGSFATFKWMVSDGGSAVEVKSGGNQDDTFTLGEALTKLGKTMADVPVWDGTGTAPAGGLTITVSCKISLVGSSLPEKSSDNSYPHDTVNYFTIYRDPP